jgi:hypothetical protein
MLSTAHRKRIVNVKLKLPDFVKSSLDANRNSKPSVVVMRKPDRELLRRLLQRHAKRNKLDFMQNKCVLSKKDCHKLPRQKDLPASKKPKGFNRKLKD